MSREEQIILALKAVSVRVHQREALRQEILAARDALEAAKQRLHDLEFDMITLPDLEWTSELHNALLLIGAYHNGDDIMIAKLSLGEPE